MKRRDFLVGSMGALAAGVTGCTGINQIVAPNWPDITPLQMDRFLTGLDGSMNRVTENSESGRFLSELQQKTPSDKDARLYRQSMRSLLLAGNFGDLSVAGQVHPGVQKRLQYSAPEMDAAVSGTTDHMKSLSPTARADIQSALREDPTLGDRVLETIELEAAAVGASNRRVMQLHVMGKHIVERLKHSSDIFINEYVTKCEKLTATPGSVAEMQRFMAARMGQAAFKAHVKEAENAVRHWQRQDLTDIPIGYQPVAQESTNDEGFSVAVQRVQPRGSSKKESVATKGSTEPSDNYYRFSAKYFRIGAVTTGIGWLLLGLAAISFEIAEENPVGIILAIPGVVAGVTVGPILIILALLSLLIGGIVDIFDGP